MNVYESDIAKHILEFKGIYTATIAGDPYVIDARNSCTLIAKGLHGCFSGFNTTGKAIFIPDNSVEHVEVEVIFSPELIAEIKAAALDKAIQCNLERLYPAAKEMVRHYNDSTPAVKNRHYIRMYVLKDIDFVQAGKGHVLICPTNNDELDNADFIKGYIYYDEHDSIKYETVQAWRYRRVRPDEISADQRWVSLMDRPKNY